MDGRSHEETEAVTRIDGPVGLKALFAALSEYVAAARIRASRGELAFRDGEAEVRRLCAMIETSAAGMVLEAFDTSGEFIEVEGRQYKRLSEPSEATYLGMAGPLRVLRHLFRETGVRNGPTVVPLELDAGIVEGLATPLAAKSAAHLLQALTSREAERLCEELGVLGGSRSSLLRIANALGARWEEQREEAEDAVMSAFEVPESATAVSVSVDRVSMPMEEPRPRKRGRPKAGAAKRPVSVVFRMAYCGVLTLHDGEGRPVASLRYGRMPGENARAEIESSIAGDLAAIIAMRPELRIVALADGAPEMQGMLDRITAPHNVEVRLIDFWHLVEKLAEAVKATGREVGPIIGRWKRNLLKDDKAIERIEIELRTWALAYEEGEQPDGLHEARTYIENNRERMRYASARASRLPIGSGTVEATCKTLVTVRMKRSGARWKGPGGQAILNLRSLAVSRRWQPAMDFLLDTYRVPVYVIAAVA
jgi:hypothetical protein